ncbi:hypothetical protein BLA29_000990, partial [Euroglyphus maynei]
MNIEQSSSRRSNINTNDPDANNKREPNVGFVKFTCHVIIHEIRIIPLSTLVSAETLRRVHLGFSYKEHENHVFRPAVSVATDGLFLRGHFESVTLAVLGEVTNLSSLITKESTTTSRISNEINIDNDDLINNSRQARANYFDGRIVDIKEPDDTQDYLETEIDKLIDDSLPPNKDDNVSVTTSAKSQHPVQDVHLLSPSPEN